MLYYSHHMDIFALINYFFIYKFQFDLDQLYCVIKIEISENLLHNKEIYVEFHQFFK